MTDKIKTTSPSLTCLGLPAVSIPASLSSRGLPVGLQLIGQRLQDRKLLSVAHWMEQQLDFPFIRFYDEGGTQETKSEDRDRERTSGA